jgi:hypothetical protein
VEGWFILVPVALTSAAVLAACARRRHALRALPLAAGKAIEAVGLTVLFFLANVGTGALVTFLSRALGVGFISIYLSTDVALLILSLVQALVFQRWREQWAARPPAS